MRIIPRWAALAVVLPAVAALGGARPAAGGTGAAPLALVIETVRGYDVTTIRRTFPAYNQGLFERLFGAGPGIPLAHQEQQALFVEQNVITPAGDKLDVGHVITGLEAGSALPPAARLAERATGCTMVAAVTWSGDVGKALHDYLAERQRDPSFYYEREAPPEDLLGDVDGWVLGVEAAGAPVDVAALLEREYLSGTLEAARFHRFAATLGGAEGAVLSDAARVRVQSEIECFARALATFTGSGVGADAIAAQSAYFVERFIAFLETGLARET